MMEEIIALDLTNLGQTMSLVAQGFEDRTFLGKLKLGDLRLSNVKKAMEEISNLVKLVDDFHGPSKGRYHSILWQYSYTLYAQVCSYVIKKPNDITMLNLKVSEEFGKINSFITGKMPLSNPNPRLAPAVARPQQVIRQQSENPSPAPIVPEVVPNLPLPPAADVAQPHVAIAVHAPVADQKLSLFGSLWLRLTNFFIFADSNEYAQYNFFRKGLWWIMKAIQYPLTAITDFTEAVLRTTVSNLFYYLRHPNYIGNEVADFDFDEDINLNAIQYGIKEIAVGLDKTIQNLFAIKNLVIHPSDSLVNLYEAIERFYKSQNKWEQIKDTVNNKFQHILQHPFQYLPDLIIFLATMIPVVYAGVRAASGAGAVATIASPLVEERIVAGAIYVMPSFVAQEAAIGAVAFNAFAAPTLTLAPAALGVGVQLLAESAVVGTATVVGIKALPSLFKSPYSDLSKEPAKTIYNVKKESSITIIPSRVDELRSNLVFLKDSLGIYTGEDDKSMRDKIVEEIDLTRNAILQLDPISSIIKDEIAAAEATVVYLIRNLRNYKLPKDKKLIAQVNDELEEQQQELKKLRLLVGNYDSSKPVFNADKDVSNRTSENKNDVFFKQLEVKVAFDGTSTKKQVQSDLPDQAATVDTRSNYAPG